MYFDSRFFFNPMVYRETEFTHILPFRNPQLSAKFHNPTNMKDYRFNIFHYTEVEWKGKDDISSES